MRFSPLVDRIGGEGAEAWAIHAEALAAKARGEDVIVMSVGDPDVATPAAVTEAAVAALRGGDTHYTDVLGEAPLRAAIARHAAGRTGLALGPGHVCVTAGAQNGLFSASLLLLRPGDEVLVPDPSYVTYEATIRASGAEPVAVPAAPGFRPDLAALEAAVGPGTRAIMYADPNNPTGVSMTAAEAAAIAGIAARHDLWVIADEVYAGLTYAHPHTPVAALPGMAERTVTVGSLSKTHAMTGWRVGWMIGPPDLIAHAGNLALAMHYGLPAFVQSAAVTAVERAEEITADMTARFRARRDALLAAIGDAPGLAALRPDAGMFVLADIRGTGLSSHDFAWGLLRAEGVSVLDGAAFGPSAAGHVRLSCTLEEERLEAAGARIARYCRSLAEAPPAVRA